MEQIAIEAVDEGSEIIITGSLSVQKASEFKDLLLETASVTDQVILNLAGLKNIDMSCLQLIFALSRSFMSSGKRLVFRENLSDAFTAALKTAGLNEYLTNQTIATEKIWGMGENNG